MLQIDSVSQINLNDICRLILSRLRGERSTTEMCYTPQLSKMIKALVRPMYNNTTGILLQALRNTVLRVQKIESYSCKRKVMCTLCQLNSDGFIDKGFVNWCEPEKTLKRMSRGCHVSLQACHAKAKEHSLLKNMSAQNRA